MFELKIPAFPISVNHCFKQGRKWGTRYKTKEYLAWEKQAEVALCQVKEIPKFFGTLSVEIELHAPDWFTKKGNARKKDLDNFSKTVLDSVFKHLEIDDSWIFELKMVKINSNSQFLTVLRIAEMANK